MLCDNCGKNEATMHYTEIINGKKKVMHLCSECAKNNNEFESPFSIHNFLTGLLESKPDGPMKVDYVEPKKCEGCGMTYGKFKQTGKFGCDQCYEAFKDRLDPLFKRIHGHNNHTGKVPKRAGGRIRVRKEIKDLRDKLEKSIKSEEFERAAELRDKIRDLKSKIDE